MNSSNDSSAFLEDLERSLKHDATEPSLQSVLDRILDRFNCVVGTIHSLDGPSGMLKLRAQRGIPEAIRDQVQVIPVGKGMAGLAAERREPVQVCNLQTDESGVAKPGARTTRMEGAISLPIFVDDNLRGTLGVAKPVAYEFSQDETDLLMKIGSVIGRYLE